MKVPAIQIVQFAFKELGLMVTMNQRLDFDQIELIACAFGFEAVTEERVRRRANAGRGRGRRPRTGRVRRSSRSWVTSTTARPRCSTTSGRRTSSRARPAASRSTSAPTTSSSRRQGDHVPRHAGPRGVHRHARPRRPGDRHRRAGRRGRRPGHAADDRGDQPREERGRAASSSPSTRSTSPPPTSPKVKQDLLRTAWCSRSSAATVLSAEISAKKGTGIDELLEQMLLQAEMLELKANPDGRAPRHRARGDARPGQGPGRHRARPEGHAPRRRRLHLRPVLGPRARPVRRARASRSRRPGRRFRSRCSASRACPAAGDPFVVVADALAAREIAQKRQRLDREAQNRRTGSAAERSKTSHRALKAGEVSALPIIIKADQGGPAEALADALAQLSHQRSAGRGRPPRRRRHHRERRAARQGVGRDHPRLPRAARRERPRRRRARAGRRPDLPRSSTRRWTTCGRASKACSSPRRRKRCWARPRCSQIFKISKVGTIAGCMVRQGIIQRTAKARVVRDGTVVYTGIAVEPQAVQGRREGSARGPRVRYRHRELQRPQGRRPHRVVPGRGGQAHAGVVRDRECVRVR